MLDLQVNLNFGDPNPKSWLSVSRKDNNSSPSPPRTQSSLANMAPTPSVNLDQILFKDLIEIVPLFKLKRRKGFGFCKMRRRLVLELELGMGKKLKSNNDAGRGWQCGVVVTSVDGTDNQGRMLFRLLCTKSLILFLHVCENFEDLLIAFIVLCCY